MGAPPALLWAARHPDEVRGLLYLDEPVLLPDIMTKTIAFTPEATTLGGLWWWAMALAPGVTDALVVGCERAFLTWFYDHYAADRSAIESGAVDEYLRSFSGKEGVDGAFGVYRAIFKTIEQTARLAGARTVKVPVVALGGEKSIGDKAKEMMASVAERVTGGAVPGCGHFIPEERPEVVVEHVEGLTAAAGR
jgi:pimeloyl-ACP methyl ester carboxylesterase